MHGDFGGCKLGHLPPSEGLHKGILLPRLGVGIFLMSAVKPAMTLSWPLTSLICSQKLSRGATLFTCKSTKSRRRCSWRATAPVAGCAMVMSACRVATRIFEAMETVHEDFYTSMSKMRKKRPGGTIHLCF